MATKLEKRYSNANEILAYTTLNLLNLVCRWFPTLKHTSFDGYNDKWIHLLEGEELDYVNLMLRSHGAYLNYFERQYWADIDLNGFELELL